MKNMIWNDMKNVFMNAIIKFYIHVILLCIVSGTSRVKIPKLLYIFDKPNTSVVWKLRKLSYTRGPKDIFREKAELTRLSCHTMIIKTIMFINELNYQKKYQENMQQVE